MPEAVPSGEEWVHEAKFDAIMQGLCTAPRVEGMRFVSLCCGILLALTVPATVSGQAVGSQPTKVASANNVSVHTKKVAKEPTGPPAKELFSAVKTPAAEAARSIGFYAKGCLAGAKALPIDGTAWQVMRLSRNRNWGHPKLISHREARRASTRARRLAGLAGWRHFSAARWADAVWPCEPSGRAGCRYLVNADARGALVGPATRKTARYFHARRRQGVHRSARLDGRAHACDQTHGVLSDRRADFRASGHQEGAVRDCSPGQRSLLAAQGACLLGAQRSLPYAHSLPRRQPV